MKTKTKLLMLGGLVMACLLSMGTFYYASSESRAGSAKVQSFTAATAAAETITAADGQSFTWPTLDQVRFAIVQLASTATGNLYCRLNESTANASGSDWDFYLEPGQSWSGFADVQLGIDEITCFADADPGTYGTTYVIKACD